jgi:hypothetical protein
VYSVSGSVGEPDAGALSGGSYQLTGGFWSVIDAIQTEGAPLLRVTRDETGVVVSWPFPSTGFALHETTAMRSPSSAILWTDVTSPAAEHVGSNWTVTLTLPVGNHYFRLHKP